jgi:predicted nucleic acid-binding protein
MKVVSDTSPLHYLILIGEIRVLAALFGRLLVPVEVIHELAHPRSPDLVREWAGSSPSWIDVINGTTALSDPKLGPGESAAIAVALERSTDLLLIDERYGTKVARDLGIESVGTVGVLAAAAERDLVSLRESYAALRATSFRGPEELMDELVRINEQRRG